MNLYPNMTIVTNNQHAPFVIDNIKHTIIKKVTSTDMDCLLQMTCEQVLSCVCLMGKLYRGILMTMLHQVTISINLMTTCLWNGTPWKATS